MKLSLVSQLLACLAYANAQASDAYSEPSNLDPVEALAGHGIKVDELSFTSFVEDLSATDEHCRTAASTLAFFYPKQVLLRDTATYNEWRANFWSGFQAEAKPAIIFQPKSAQEVAITVLISRWTRCKFAVKSGGHAAMRGASSKDGGITVDLANLNGIQLTKDKKVAKIGPGNTWGRVYKELEKSKLSVLGGRVRDIGVGGLTLGGGVSYFSALYGWACDNVVNYELVTASGLIINVSEKSYPDLFWALRGGGPNFGIVTRFDTETFPQGDVFAGNIYYPDVFRSDVISAFSKFAENEDPKASTWFIPLYVQGTKLLNVLSFYKDPNPQAAAFADYRAIPSALDDTAVRSLSSAAELQQASIVDGLQEMYWTHTFKFDQDFISWVTEFFFQEFEPYHDQFENFLPAPVFQIIPREAIKLMSRRGGNPLPLTVSDAPYLNFEVATQWGKKADDDTIIRLIATFISKTVAEGKRRGLFVDYVYLNYASEYQDPLKHYGQASYDRLKRVASKYDPSGVFQTLMPGYFKFGGPPRTQGPGVVN